jgi:hypothetical protein
MTMPRPPRALRVTLALSLGLQAAILAARVAFAG